MFEKVQRAMREFHFAMPEIAGWAYFGASRSLSSSGFLLHYNIASPTTQELQYRGFIPAARQLTPPPSRYPREAHCHLEVDEKTIWDVLALPNSAVWTGAGFSRSAGILTFPELEAALSLDNPFNFIEIARHRPEVLAKSYYEFVYTLLNAKPTLGHYVLKKWCIGQRRIWTENMDSLHEKTKSIVVRRQEIDQSLSDGNLPAAIVTIGLREDPRGLASKLYAQGVQLFAVTCDPPDYPTTGWCKADAQYLLTKANSFILS